MDTSVRSNSATCLLSRLQKFIDLVQTAIPAEASFRFKHLHQHHCFAICRYDTTLLSAKIHVRLYRNPAEQPESREPGQSHTMRALLDSDLGSHVVSECGVLLSCHGPPQTSEVEPAADSLVLVPSTCRNLRRLALAVATGSPVLLEGAVGSGKTALVQHLARRTGHKGAPQLTKIQLGDQTDSKV